jgi:hypothetical protein
MNAFWGHLIRAIAGSIAISLASPVTALAEDAAPTLSYTYLGAGYEWGDSRCAVEPTEAGVSGYTVDGSVGIFRFLHLTGRYYDGDTDSGNNDLTCYEVGGGLSYTLTEGADIVLRGYYVDVDYDGSSGDADGFEPELLVRFAISDRAEIDVGMAYFDMDDDSGEDFNNTEVRINLGYEVLPWLALRVGGAIFDEDSSVNAGIRANFGGSLF